MYYTVKLYNFFHFVLHFQSYFFCLVHLYNSIHPISFYSFILTVFTSHISLELNKERENEKLFSKYFLSLINIIVYKIALLQRKNELRKIYSFPYTIFIVVYTQDLFYNIITLYSFLFLQFSPFRFALTLSKAIKGSFEDRIRACLLHADNR